MAKPKNTDEPGTGDPKTEPPGPKDHGHQGGMATREVADDLGTEEHAQEPPD
ncbi:hypothetical protein ACWDOP_24715 [Nocardia sp. NPDC003693]